MAYVTGTVDNLAELVTAIRNACTSNGWTLSDSVLHKGNVHMRVAYVPAVVSPAAPAYMEFLAGTGIDGSNNLVDPGPQAVRMHPLAQAFTFPMTYEVHILTSPDEVYVVINYAADFYQWAAWGQSTVQGLSGTGVWYAATIHGRTPPPTSIMLLLDSGNGGLNNSTFAVPVLFGARSNLSNFLTQNSFVHHGLDGQTWNPANPGIFPVENGWWGLLALLPLTAITPNAWNDEMVLLPIEGWKPRAAGNKISLLVDLAHARHCRINFHDPGDVVTIGPDQWKIYPCYRKDGSVTGNPGENIQHTGTMGFAVRYTGVG